jgi:hypothetical protein
MTLARVWTRQLYGAWGVALLAPATMIAALAVLALSGGFGGLSALGQLVSGPAVPVGANASAGRTAPATGPQLLPVVPASAPTAGAATRAATRVAAVSPGVTRPGGAGGGRSRTGGGGQRVGSGGGHGATQPVAGPPPTTQPAPPVGTPSPPPATGPVPALVNQVVAIGVSVTSKLPAPLAAIGTGALQSLGQTLNTLLAPQP